MRIVHISTLHAALDVRIFHKQCRTLASAGHDVHLLVNHPPAAEIDGVHFHALCPRSSRIRPLRIRRRLIDARDRAIALAGDVYHFHDAELIVIAKELRRTGAKVIYDVHEDSPQEVLDMNKDRPFYAAAKHFVFKRLWKNSHHVVDHFVCATPALTALFPADRATTIANYPLLEEFNIGGVERPGPSVSPKFIFIGGISTIRGAKEMIEAVQLLPADHRLETGATVCDARLLLIGEFHPPGLQDELERMPGWSRVEFLSWQPREKLIEHLSRAVAGLVLFHPAPNHTEALPNKIFEYMAAGLPVIATDFPLWRDLISRESCGLLANALDPRSIADAMRRILEQRDEAAAMGQRGMKAVRSRYNWTQEAQKLLALYDALGKGRRPSECTD